jgi:hypothetical protein
VSLLLVLVCWRLGLLEPPGANDTNLGDKSDGLMHVGLLPCGLERESDGFVGCWTLVVWKEWRLGLSMMAFATRDSRLPRLAAELQWIGLTKQGTQQLTIPNCQMTFSYLVSSLTHSLA